MATVHSLLRGEISGKMGDKVYYQLNGKTVVRNLPAKTKWTFTAKQTKAQQRFKSIIHYCQKFKYSVIPLIWNKGTQSGSGWSLFMKTNSPAFNPEGVPADVRKLQLSTGKLTLPLQFTAHRKAGDPSVIEVSWNRNLSMGGILLWDELMAISSVNDEYSPILSTGIIRGDLQGSFLLPVLKAEATHLFLFFASNDRTTFSTSVCFEI